MRRWLELFFFFLHPCLRQSQPLNWEHKLLFSDESPCAPVGFCAHYIQNLWLFRESYNHLSGSLGGSDYIYHLQGYLLPRGPEFTQRGRSVAGGQRSEVVGRPLREVGTTWRSWSWSGIGWTRWWRH